GAALACPASASLYSLVYPKIQPKSKTLNSFNLLSKHDKKVHAVFALESGNVVVVTASGAGTAV
ncbi:hypothetical protein, partial [Rufibacter quisquiliarum]|uniref:hypothetical protein n=1 Tax=Rufibacter quisquiliarum TaxID=1549639 RepID=UPI001C71D064